MAPVVAQTDVELKSGLLAVCPVILQRIITDNIHKIQAKCKSHILHLDPFSKSDHPIRLRGSADSFPYPRLVPKYRYLLSSFPLCSVLMSLTVPIVAQRQRGNLPLHHTRSTVYSGHLFSVPGPPAKKVRIGHSVSDLFRPCYPPCIRIFIFHLVFSRGSCYSSLTSDISDLSSVFRPFRPVPIRS